MRLCGAQPQVIHILCCPYNYESNKMTQDVTERLEEPEAILVLDYFLHDINTCLNSCLDFL